MNPQQDPLSQLRDIHLPAPIDSFQLAPGWWLLIAVIILLGTLLVRQWLKRRKARIWLKPAKRELALLASKPANTRSVAELSEFLKRFCLLHFPKSQVASLSGKEWINFLNSQSSHSRADEPCFEPQLQRLLCQSIYQPEQAITSELWQQLIDSSSTFTTRVIKYYARKPK